MKLNMMNKAIIPNGNLYRGSSNAHVWACITNFNSKKVTMYREYERNDGSIGRKFFNVPRPLLKVVKPGYGLEYSLVSVPAGYAADAGML